MPAWPRKVRAKQACHQTTSKHERAIGQGLVQEAIACRRRAEGGGRGEGTVQVLLMHREAVTAAANATENHAESGWDDALRVRDGGRGPQGAEGYVPTSAQLGGN